MGTLDALLSSLGADPVEPPAYEAPKTTWRLARVAPLPVPAKDQASKKAAPEQESPAVVRRRVVASEESCQTHPKRSVIRVTRDTNGLVVEVQYVSHPGRSRCREDKATSSRLRHAVKAVGVPYYFWNSIGFGNEYGMVEVGDLEGSLEANGFKVERAVRPVVPRPRPRRSQG